MWEFPLKPFRQYGAYQLGSKLSRSLISLSEKYDINGTTHFKSLNVLIERLFFFLTPNILKFSVQSNNVRFELTTYKIHTIRTRSFRHYEIKFSVNWPRRNLTVCFDTNLNHKFTIETSLLLVIALYIEIVLWTKITQCQD